MNNTEIYTKLKASGAIRSGHFQLTSGRHSDTYMQCARILEDPALTTDLAREMVARLPKDLEVDLVAAPAVGGIIIGFAVAQALDTRFIFSERQNGTMVFRRAFEVPKGTKVLVVEDVVTTGGSVNEVVQLVREAGGEVAGVTSIIDRGGDKAFDAPFYPLLELNVESWDPANCQLCQEGIELYSPGSRRLAK
jgi:orotate phosphoribosyltransferase